VPQGQLQALGTHRAHCTQASAHAASARAAFAFVATGNHSSGPISVTAHLASGLITKPASCSSLSSAGAARSRYEPSRRRPPANGPTPTRSCATPPTPSRPTGQPLFAASATRLLMATALAVFVSNALTGPTIEDRHEAHPAILRRAIAFIEENAPTDIAAACFVTIRAPARLPPPPGHHPHRLPAPRPARPLPP